MRQTVDPLRSVEPAAGRCQETVRINIDIEISCVFEINMAARPGLVSVRLSQNRGARSSWVRSRCSRKEYRAGSAVLHSDQTIGYADDGGGIHSAA